ncbi:MAG: DUF364 domain-containing protein [Deltaproteobacteria bacterium]|nr:DUF364 domain-containing protein [Deltaproteobacteria bacterium]
MLATPADKWNFFQGLVDAVDPEDRVADCHKGRFWMLVKSDKGGVGLSLFLPDPTTDYSPPKEEIVGKRLAELAPLFLSWDSPAASVGLAAINASLSLDCLKGKFEDDVVDGNAFDIFAPRVKGKRIGVIGHFPHLRRLAGSAREMVIFERIPQPGDLPDTAAEYLLPEMDAVFMTGSTLVNKTVPRLLELSRNAEVYLVGPSVPLCPDLFKYGITALCGTVVLDYARLALLLNKPNALHLDPGLSRRLNLFSSKPPAGPRA